MFEGVVSSIKKLIKKMNGSMSSKKFIVEREGTTQLPPPSPDNIRFTPSNDINNTTNSEGRFRIDGERQIEHPEAIHPIGQSNSASSRGLRVEAVTRPKQCPICRTANKITRLPSNHWKCTECGHTWN